jgi:hypothetical protein
MDRSANAPAPVPTPLFARSTVASRSIKPKHEPLVGRESSTARKLQELELIVRRIAATDPYFETIDDEVFCALCEARNHAHRDDCVWLAAEGWVRSYLP